MLEYSLIFFFPFLMAYSAASDLVSMTISNRVSLCLMGGFMFFALWLGMDYATIAWHWAMFAIVLTAGFSLFAFGVIGGGDAKLAASTALWFGWEHSMSYFVLSAVLGGVLTLILLKVRGTPLPDRLLQVNWINRLYRSDTGVPYGIALGLAAMAIYPDTPWMELVYEGVLR